MVYSAKQDSMTDVVEMKPTATTRTHAAKVRSNQADPSMLVAGLRSMITEHTNAAAMKFTTRRHTHAAEASYAQESCTTAAAELRHTMKGNISAAMASFTHGGQTILAAELRPTIE